MGVGHAHQTFRVHRHSQRALQIGGRVAQLAEMVRIVREIGQDPSAQIRVGVLRTVERAQRAHVGLDGRRVSLLASQHGAHFRVDGRSQFGIIRGSLGGGRKRLLPAAHREEGHSA